MEVRKDVRHEGMPNMLVQALRNLAESAQLLISLWHRGERTCRKMMVAS